MAKKKALRKQSPNMSAEIRSLLERDRNISCRDAIAALEQKHPRATVNRNSCTVAFYTARRDMGTSATALDMPTLQRARRFVAEVGDVETALQAVQQLKSLQIG